MERDGLCPGWKIKRTWNKVIFAGTQKDDPSKLHTVMQFPNMEALQAFRDDKQLTEKRREAGAVIEKCFNDTNFR